MTVSTGTSILELTRDELPQQPLLAEWDRVVRRHGDRSALSTHGGGHTFTAADRSADSVAAGLRPLLDTTVRTPVGILCGHTPEAVIAILGVLKAGHIVVLLDPHLPPARLQEIVATAGVTVCVVDQQNAALASGLGVTISHVVSLDHLLSGTVSPVGHGPAPAPPVAAAADDRADAVAIVFTSGSSGRPKGVVQTSGQLLNDVLTHRERFRLCPQDRVALVLPYGFAAGFSLLWGALLNGAGVWCYDPRDRGTRGLPAWLDDNELTTLHCTPHLLRSLTGTLPAGAVLNSLRLVSTVGEAVHGTDVVAIRPHLRPTASFVNWTGSSEIGILSLYEIAGDSEIPAGSLPAGRPAPNRQVRLIADDGSIAGEGESGEIAVVSRFLSGGYWNDPDNTARRFSVDGDGTPVVRQGDLGRFDENGDLLLLGRGDAVVKIRGYLVDPSEIETALLTLDGVKEVVVQPVFVPAAPTRLIAYVVPHPHRRPTPWPRSAVTCANDFRNTWCRGDRSVARAAEERTRQDRPREPARSGCPGGRRAPFDPVGAGRRGPLVQGARPRCRSDFGPTSWPSAVIRCPSRRCSRAWATSSMWRSARPTFSSPRPCGTSPAG